MRESSSLGQLQSPLPFWRDSSSRVFGNFRGITRGRLLLPSAFPENVEAVAVRDE